MSSPLPDRAGFPAWILVKVDAIEAELDQIHVGWKGGVPFDRAPYDLKARIKWLLKRHSLLMHTDEHGHPAPLDWDVLIARDLKNPSKCYAHPVMPALVTVEAVTREPAPMHRAAVALPQIVDANSPAYIAGVLEATVEDVTEALSTMPATWMGMPLAWVRRCLGDAA